MRKNMILAMFLLALVPTLAASEVVSVTPVTFTVSAATISKVPTTVYATQPIVVIYNNTKTATIFATEKGAATTISMVVFKVIKLNVTNGKVSTITTGTYSDTTTHTYTKSSTYTEVTTIAPTVATLYATSTTIGINRIPTLVIKYCNEAVVLPVVNATTSATQTYTATTGISTTISVTNTTTSFFGTAIINASNATLIATVYTMIITSADMNYTKTITETSHVCLQEGYVLASLPLNYTIVNISVNPTTINRTAVYQINRTTVATTVYGATTTVTVTPSGSIAGTPLLATLFALLKEKRKRNGKVTQ